MLDVVIKNLGARKMRSVLCILAVMAGVFLNGMTLIMNHNMYTTMTSELARYMGKIFVQQSGASYPSFDSSISQETAEEILARDDLGLNVAESAPLLLIRTERSMNPFMQALSMVAGIPAGREEALLGNVEATEGVNRFDAGERGNVAILGESAAQSLGASVGQDITVSGQTVRVIGILKTSTLASVNISTIMPLEAVQRIFDKEGLVSALVLTPNDVNEALEIAETLRQDYPLLGVETQDDMLAEAEEVLRMPLMYMTSMGVTGMVVTVAVIMSTMFMAVVERTREFGALRAIGARRRLILGLVLTEALLLAIIGGLPGIGLSLLMTRMMKVFTQPSAVQFLQILVLAIVAAVLAGVYPAWRAARMDPVEALRYE